MDELVSIIVPVYNIESMIISCLDSIFEQTYKNIEVIVVNDGSTDSSEKIIKQFIKGKEIFKLLSKNNGGLSSARNYGLHHAKGTYVCFIDGDDMVSPTFVFDHLKHLYKNSEFDFSICGYIKEKNGEKPKSIILNEGIYNSFDLLNLSLYNPGYSLVTTKMFRRIFLKQLLFLYNKIHEDEYFFNSCILKMNKAISFKETLYIYKDRNNSIMNTISLHLNFDAFDAIYQRYEICLKNKRKYDYRQCAQLAVGSFISTIQNMKKHGVKLSAMKRVKNLLFHLPFSFNGYHLRWLIMKEILHV